ncbi:YoaP domain-containing protein [Clostridium formicaceticum]|uniref:YoaP domain-containing protein n=1 Tax=Clostridium formicaceticum TaxID=1497 RepID=UPI0030037A79
MRVEEKGITLYYSNQCPHTEKYAPIIADIAKKRGIEFILIKFQSKEEVQKAPAPFTTYSLFYEGKFVTNEILSEKKFIDFLKKIYSRCT